MTRASAGETCRADKIRRMRKGPLEPSPLLAELAAADDPPTELEAYLARLRQAGATEVSVARRTDDGVMFDLSTAEQAHAGSSVVTARGPRVIASWEIDWKAPSGAPIRDALERLVDEFQAFDQIARFRFAATDMGLAAQAAAALIEAADFRGSARAYERVIETGMIVTYTRPFLPSNEAGLGKSWWPEGEAERELHEELIDLRGVYQAHATHTPERQLQIVFAHEGRPVLAEQWTKLPVAKLELLRQMAARQAERFRAEADRLEVELFGPLDTTDPGD